MPAKAFRLFVCWRCRGNWIRAQTFADSSFWTLPVLSGVNEKTLESGFGFQGCDPVRPNLDGTASPFSLYPREGVDQRQPKEPKSEWLLIFPSLSSWTLIILREYYLIPNQKCSPTKIDYRNKRCPYSNLSTGGPSCGVSFRSTQGTPLPSLGFVSVGLDHCSVTLPPCLEPFDVRDLVPSKGKIVKTRTPRTSKGSMREKGGRVNPICGDENSKPQSKPPMSGKSFLQSTPELSPEAMFALGGSLSALPSPALRDGPLANLNPFERERDMFMFACCFRVRFFLGCLVGLLWLALIGLLWLVRFDCLAGLGVFTLLDWIALAGFGWSALVGLLCLALVGFPGLG